MNRKVKTIIFVTCSVAFIGLTILFGWLGFTGDKTSDRMSLSYTDKVCFSSTMFSESIHTNHWRIK